MSSTSIGDAGVGRQVPLTRRSALRAGAVATLAATVAALQRMTEGDAAQFVRQLADDPLEIGPGNRPHDRMDEEDALTRQVAVTHAAVVARLADLDAGNLRGRVYIESEAKRQAREEIVARYGPEVGRAIDRAAFQLYMHRKYHDPGAQSSCEECIADGVS